MSGDVSGDTSGEVLVDWPCCEEVQVIYSVVPPELGEEVYARLVERYKDNPNITVIMDRRKADRRKDRSGGGGRETRDRRRRRLPGSFDV